jgi:hypothetical protein
VSHVFTGTAILLLAVTTLPHEEGGTLGAIVAFLVLSALWHRGD